MGLRSRVVRVCVVLAAILVYATVLWLGMTEENRRSLAIANAYSSSGDYVIANVRVTSIEPAQGLLHGQVQVFVEAQGDEVGRRLGAGPGDAHSLVQDHLDLAF